MSIKRIVTLSLFVLIVCGMAVAAAVAPILAQTPGPTDAANGAEAASQTVNYSFLAWTLVFTLLTLVIIFLYTYFVQKEFYETVLRLGAMGRAIGAVLPETFVTPMSVESFPSADVERETLESTDAEGPAEERRIEPLQITGPPNVMVGQESDAYSVVRLQDGGKPADDAVWLVEPANAATLVPVKGAKVKVTAALAGAFVLVAKVSDPIPGEARLPVASLVPQASAVEIPFVGRAYGSIAVAVVLIGAIIVLALGGVLGSEGVATLFGALLGYIFGVTTTGTASRANGKTGSE